MNCPLHPETPRVELCYLPRKHWPQRIQRFFARQRKEIMSQFCPTHPETPLICPKCEGSKGGQKRAESHSHEQLSKWSKKGGRPRKKHDWTALIDRCEDCGGTRCKYVFGH